MSNPTGVNEMTQERSLWDYVEAGGSKEESLQKLDKARTRQQTIKRLRSSGHWLTLLRVDYPAS